MTSFDIPGYSDYYFQADQLNYEINELDEDEEYNENNDNNPNSKINKLRALLHLFSFQTPILKKIQLFNLHYILN